MYGRIYNTSMDATGNQRTDAFGNPRTDAMGNQRMDAFGNPRIDTFSNQRADESGEEGSRTITSIGQNSAEINWEYALIERLDERDLSTA